MTTATGIVHCSNWKEAAYYEMDGGAKLSRATTQNSYAGDIQAESTIEYLMYYSNSACAHYTGLERVVGRLGDKSGGFVLQHVGTFQNGVSHTLITVLPGSGVGDLVGIKGQGQAIWSGEHGKPSSYTLEYEFP